MSEFKNQVFRAGVIGISAGIADFAATSGWMHRSLTHKAYQLPKPAETTARTIIWGTGVKPRAWAAVHRQHHEFADQEGDPHSPVLLGRYGVWKLLLRNPFLYRKAALNVKDTDLPADLKPDRLDLSLFDNVKLGLSTSLLAHMAVNKLLGNKATTGLLSFAAEKLMYVSGGNLVNAIGHSGAKPLKALVLGEIQPNEDGSYGQDSTIVGALTLGEGMQRYHHDHPGSAYFGPTAHTNLPRRLFRDVLGAVALELIERDKITVNTLEFS